MNRIYGCDMRTLDQNACAGWTGWAFHKGEAPEGSQELPWALAHAYDGVTWGRSDNGQAPQWGCDVFPGKCPVPSEENVTELRLFGPRMEVYLWRVDTGWAGRMILEKKGNDVPAEFLPAEEWRILRADRVLDTASGDFTGVGDNTGSAQVVPLPCSDDDFERRRWPLKLKLCSYFEQDEVTGAVRIAAVRLMDLVKEA